MVSVLRSLRARVIPRFQALINWYRSPRISRDRFGRRPWIPPPARPHLRPFVFLQLPGEVRNRIYEYCLESKIPPHTTIFRLRDRWRIPDTSLPKAPEIPYGLIDSCRQIRQEMLPLFVRGLKIRLMIPDFQLRNLSELRMWCCTNPSRFNSPIRSTPIPSSWIGLITTLTIWVDVPPFVRDTWSINWSFLTEMVALKDLYIVFMEDRKWRLRYPSYIPRELRARMPIVQRTLKNLGSALSRNVSVHFWQPPHETRAHPAHIGARSPCWLKKEGFAQIACFMNPPGRAAMIRAWFSPSRGEFALSNFRWGHLMMLRDSAAYELRYGPAHTLAIDEVAALQEEFNNQRELVFVRSMQTPTGFWI